MMNFKHIFFCFLTAFFFSCSENDYSSYCPTWKGFTYKTGNYPNYVNGNPRNILLHPGDSIHITDHQKERGHLINATSYTWTISYDTIDVKSGERVRVPATKSYTKRTNYDGYIDGADDPVCHMLLPANALPTESGKPYSVTFVARYTYSGQGVTIETGNIVDNSAYSGTITPQSGPTAGGASGTLKFSVEER